MITSEDVKDIVSGNSSAIVFTFDFKVFNAAAVKVVHKSAAGVETALVKDTHYTVTLNVNQDTNPGGSITYPRSGSPALPTGEKLAIYSDETETQETDLQVAITPAALEDRLDYLTRLVQQHSEMLARVPLGRVSDVATMDLGTAASRASKFLNFDSSGNASLATVPTLPLTEAAVLAVLTSAGVGGLLYPLNATEIALGVSLAAPQLPYGDYARYSATPSAANLAAIVGGGAYRESASVYAVAVGGKQRAKVTGDSTITELQLWSTDVADTGDVFIRFCEDDGKTKGFLGFTASGDNTFSMTSYKDFRLKFRTGNDDATFYNRVHIYGSLANESWLAVESPRVDDIGGCYVRFVEDDISTTKGYVGFASTTDNGLYLINSKNNQHIEVQTAGTGKIKLNAPLALVSGVAAPGTLANYGLLYIDNADGDLKFQFPNGTLATLAAN